MRCVLHVKRRPFKTLCRCKHVYMTMIRTFLYERKRIRSSLGDSLLFKLCILLLLLQFQRNEEYIIGNRFAKLANYEIMLAWKLIETNTRVSEQMPFFLNNHELTYPHQLLVKLIFCLLRCSMKVRLEALLLEDFALSAKHGQQRGASI